MAQLGNILTSLLALASLIPQDLAAYTLADDYTGASFFEKMTFFTDQDPTKGYVNYVDQTTAQSLGLIDTDNQTVVMRVDSMTPVASGRGRNSIRVQSNKSYNHGLWVLDVAHMPGGVCGTWPSWWTTSSSVTWPKGGEIDIIENVNDATTNYATLHTGGTGQLCSFPNQTQLAHSHMTTLGCDVNSPGQKPNQGCAANDIRTDSFGAGFNANGGGIYAMQWSSQAINIFFFPRGGNTPSDVLGDSPNPANWGQPTAVFSGGCNIDQFFKDQQMIFNIALCGDWAGKDWATTPSCAAKAPTCQQYVQNNPSAFKDSYWAINALKVYSENGAPVAQPPAQSASSSSAPTAAAPPVSTTSIFASTPSVAAVSTPASSALPQQSTTASVVLVTSTVTAPAVMITPVAALQADEFGTGSSGIAQRRQRRRVSRHLKGHLHSGNF